VALAVVVLSIGFGSPARSANGGVYTCAYPAPAGAAWVAAMPAATPTSVTKTNVDIPAPDGVTLFARVYLPDAFEKPLPTVFVFSPYLDGAAAYAGEREDVQHPAGPYNEAGFFLCHGYAVVLADLRGTGNSGGCYDWGGPLDQQDGKAIVDWIARQSWSDGTLGMRDYSLPGLSQLATAVAAPDALKAIIPTSATGEYEIAHAGATLHQAGPFAAAYIGANNALPPGTPSSAAFPDAVVNSVCGPEHAAALTSRDGTLNEYWQVRDMARLAERIKAAVLYPVGHPNDNVTFFGQVWAALEAAGVPRKGIVGNWGHQLPAINGWLFYELRWFEHWLRGNDTGVMDEPALTLYDQDGVVRTADGFHAAEVVLEAGAGTLSDAAPPGASSYLGVSVVPGSVVGELPGALARYDGPALTEPVRISGAPRLHLRASLDATDTDFHVLLVEQRPDGSQPFIAQGWLDARHRRDIDRPGVDVVPGTAEDYVVDLDHTEYTVPAGSRIHMEVSSSDACYDPQTCAGLVPDGSVATVTVHEGPGLTRLVLPVA
jgi:hypothetical protein